MVIEGPECVGPVVRVVEPPKTPAPAVAKAVEPAKVGPAAAAPAIKIGVAGATLEDLRLRSYPTFTRVVVETSAMVRHRVDVVTPKELRIRLPAVSASRRAEEVRDGLIEAVQVEAAEGDTVLRVSFTGTSQEPKTSVLSDPPRALDTRAPAPGPRAVGGAAPLHASCWTPGMVATTRRRGARRPDGEELVLDVTRRVANLATHLRGSKSC
jgi:hypothetical protein